MRKQLSPMLKIFCKYTGFSLKKNKKMVSVVSINAIGMQTEMAEQICTIEELFLKPFQCYSRIYMTENYTKHYVSSYRRNSTGDRACCRCQF